MHIIADLRITNQPQEANECNDQLLKLLTTNLQIQRATKNKQPADAATIQMTRFPYT
jgi:hypothetical protein